MKYGFFFTYPSIIPGKFGKIGEKLGISAGALIRPAKIQEKQIINILISVFLPKFSIILSKILKYTILYIKL